MSERELEGRVALVTGASRGIGAATAVELARRGAHVVITARTEGGLAETDDAVRAAGGQATLLPLDLAAEGSVELIGPSLHARFGRLDILVSNAATLGTLTPVPHVFLKDWHAALAVNTTAALRLIQTCAPLLLAAPAGRAVFVTSRFARSPAAYWGIQSACKAAMEALVRAWAEETRTTRLRINFFEPGPVATRLRAEAMPGEDPSTLRRPAEVAPALAELCGPAEQRHAELIRFAG